MTDEEVEASREDSLEELKATPGVGERIIAVLREHGYTTRKEITTTSPSDPKTLPQIGDTVAERLVDAD